MRKLKAQGKLTGPALQLMQPFPEEMLFHVANDPHEIQNLAQSKDPRHKAALLRLRVAMETWIIESGDRGHIPESPEIVAPFLKEMHDWFGTPDWAKNQ